MWNEIPITVLRRVRLLVALCNISTLVINTWQIHTYVACITRALINYTRATVDRKLLVWTMPPYVLQILGSVSSSSLVRYHVRGLYILAETENNNIYSRPGTDSLYHVI